MAFAAVVFGRWPGRGGVGEETELEDDNFTCGSTPPPTLTLRACARASPLMLASFLIVGQNSIESFYEFFKVSSPRRQNMWVAVFCRGYTWHPPRFL